MSANRIEPREDAEGGGPQAVANRRRIRLVGGRRAIKARTLPPHDSGYILLAAEVDWRGAFRRPGAAQRRLLDSARSHCDRLAMRPEVLEATVFRALLVAPGEGAELLRAREGRVHRARYDVVVLIRAQSLDAAQTLRGYADYAALARQVRESARYTMEITARNAVRLGDVDHRADDVFLFNYFYADDKADLIPVFEYTAGWFQEKTNLQNSILLQPLEGEPTDNGIINHASWPSFRAFLPSLVFRPSFRRFVLANFAANNVAAQPILYRRWIGT